MAHTSPKASCVPDDEGIEMRSASHFEDADGQPETGSKACYVSPFFPTASRKRPIDGDRTTGQKPAALASTDSPCHEKSNQNQNSQKRPSDSASSVTQVADSFIYSPATSRLTNAECREKRPFADNPVSCISSSALSAKPNLPGVGSSKSMASPRAGSVGPAVERVTQPGSPAFAGLSVSSFVPALSSRDPANSATGASALAFMCFNEDMLGTFGRLQYLEEREKELTGKLKTSAGALAESEEKRRDLMLQFQAKEEEVKDRARKFEREFFNKLEDDKIKMRKLSLELNVMSKNRNVLKTELESLKISYQNLIESSAEIDAKLKTATRCQEFQAKRIESVELINDNLKAADENHRENEKKLVAQLETMERRLRDSQVEWEAIHGEAQDARAKQEALMTKKEALAAELRATKAQWECAAAESRRQSELRSAEAELRQLEAQKWRQSEDEKEKAAAEMRSKLESLLSTISALTEMKDELDRCLAEAREDRLRADRETCEVKHRAEKAEAEIAGKSVEWDQMREKAEEEAKVAAERIEVLEKEVARRKEEAERNREYIETLKASGEAQAEVLKRAEEKRRAETQDWEEKEREWKDKEVCFESQLLEMQELRERCDQLSTIQSYGGYLGTPCASCQGHGERPGDVERALPAVEGQSVENARGLLSITYPMGEGHFEPPDIPESAFLVDAFEAPQDIARENPKTEVDYDPERVENG